MTKKMAPGRAGNAAEGRNRNGGKPVIGNQSALQRQPSSASYADNRPELPRPRDCLLDCDAAWPALAEGLQTISDVAWAIRFLISTSSFDDALAAADWLIDVSTWAREIADYVGPRLAKASAGAIARQLADEWGQR